VKNIRDKTISIAFWLAVASAAVIPLAIYANWLVACIQLHHRPVPLIEDPKLIGRLTSVIYSVTNPLVDFASWALVFATSLLILISVWPQQFDRRNVIRKLCISVGAALIVLMMFKWDPGRVFEWYVD
jgi:hypothetical protein